MNLVVLGMHRSGTSAITSAVRRLGLSIGDMGDFLKPRPANPAGNWEHLRLTRCNELILGARGGTWSSPPEMPAGWSTGCEMKAMLPMLRREFDDIYESDGWIWKDPRTSLTLPLWLRAWDSVPAILLIFRHPVAVAKSLHARNGFSIESGLELWERYNRQALRNSHGLQRLIIDYDDVFLDPEGFARELRRNLAAMGLSVSDSAADAAGVFEPELRRNSALEGELAMLSPNQRRLWEKLRDEATQPTSGQP